jgi:hypothetical protein
VAQWEKFFSVFLIGGFPLPGWIPAVDGHKDGIRIFIAIGIFAKLAGSSTAIMLPRLIWMIFADPTAVARAFRRFHFCHRLSLTNQSVVPLADVPSDQRAYAKWRIDIKRYTRY